MKRNPRTIAALLRNWMCPLLFGVSLLASVNGALAAPEGVDRPHLGKCDTVIPPPPPSFPAQVEIGLTCSFRHLGLTTGKISQLLEVAGPPENGVLPLIISGTTVYIAANGDELHSTFEGEASIDFTTGAIAFTATETLAGGTGRFSGASGTSFLEGDASAATLAGFYVTLGTLSY